MYKLAAMLGFFAMGAVAGSGASAAEINTNARAGFVCCSSGSTQNNFGATTGLVSQTEAHFAGDSFGRVTSGDSFARASLASGELGVRASSVYFGNASASAGFNETLSFTVAGAAADTVTPITVLLKWHGEVMAGVSPDSGFATSFYQFDLFQGIFNATVRLDQNAGSGRETDYRTQVVGQWLSSSVIGEEDDETQIFSLTYGLKGAAPSIFLRASMGADSRLTGSADAFNTAAINFVLPETVTFTSTSGAFLSEARPINESAVPEPATWAMMIGGIGLAGTALRRRRAIAA